MTKKAVREIIESYMESEVSEETRVAFEKWLSDGSSCEEKEEALSSIWENLSLTSAASPEDPYSIIEEAQQIENVETRKKTKRKTTWLWIMSSVAACMTIFAIIGWSIPSHNETCLVSSVDSKGEFVLPDGSHVWLNRNSRLRYYNDLQGKLRKVRIEGEGYFDVAKDPEHPFVVEAGDLSITALGTSFTLYGYKHPKTGKRIVALALHNKDAVLLGLGGPLCADIIYVTHEDYVEDHGAGLSTAYGYQDTSLSPIFIAVLRFPYPSLLSLVIQ